MGKKIENKLLGKTAHMLKPYSKHLQNFLETAEDVACMRYASPTPNNASVAQLDASLTEGQAVTGSTPARLATFSHGD